MEKLLGHILTLDYSEETKQIIEVNHFLAWCAENSIKSELPKNKRVWNFQ
ncbi:MAG: hypothetical protein LN561_05715 [Rickettsia endosymbiont of Labidopullus appendiculatus]|nr:hypothetical protein [Rickettsia endosymbiont of Labidopullus appendiculatus]